MAGILNWGVHIPAYRMPAALFTGRQKEGGPERSLAWADEDSLTMAVEAARNCLRGHGHDGIDLLLFATTTHPFDEKQGAALIAAALGLSPDTRTADMTGSLRCGIQAILLADDAVRSGRVRSALVIISDCRMGAPGSELERSGGDAAVAFLIGKGDVVARLAGHETHSEEIISTWRRNGDRFVHGWEERFTAQYDILDPSVAVAAKLRAANEGGGQWLWATSAPNPRAQAAFCKAAAVPAMQMVPGLCDRVGFCGAAHAPLLLAAVLDGAKPGQSVAVIAHGDGADALLFMVEREHGTGTVAKAIGNRIPVPSLAAYRRARNLDAGEYLPADDQGISATIHFREREEDIRLQGQRCASCGEPQFPKGRVCIRCGAKDDFQPEDYAERAGALVTYTLDAFFPSPTPPTAVGVIQVDDGPRIYMQIAELPDGEPAIGMRLRFAFRRIHEVGMRPNYFWKALPERTGA